jgi:flagellin
MSLGVLNNIAATYAENNLNNTTNSLNTVLQQLSSGSKINSGADDAAGLSLVNGLQANQTALTQSETNATEGVGLLQVADGALSQVTNLLNRAVTLATEASNGTLNSTQDTAANQEYQSILSEINNIGTTTTFNQEQVFGSNTNIYTGDSSTAGASVNDLNIRSLSSSSVGDTNGTMNYSNGQSNVFIDLTSGAGSSGALAATTDTLNTKGITTIDVDYMGTNPNGTPAVETGTISAGTGTNYANTAEGLIDAINGAGLGLTASFTTAAAAGDTGATALSDTGIEISGSVGSGANPTSGSYTGTLALGGAQASDVLNGSITLQDGTNPPTTITMAEVAAGKETDASDQDLTALMNYINTGASGDLTDPFGVVAAANNAGDGLTLTSVAPATTTPVTPYAAVNVTASLTDSADTNVANPTFTYNATAGYAVGVSDSGTFGTAGVTDSTLAETADNTLQSDSSTTGGIATISYSDGAGMSLSGTDLSNQTDAKTALTNLNTAIADVAAQDGYVGAQINTLNAVSSVLSTQSENVQSAQNAVQATDYASATSAMSKYEILSQTGISALAQANSMQQEVTKLLQ